MIQLLLVVPYLTHPLNFYSLCRHMKAHTDVITGGYPHSISLISSEKSEADSDKIPPRHDRLLLRNPFNFY
jgi:hypothetical protein